METIPFLSFDAKLKAQNKLKTDLFRLMLEYGHLNCDNTDQSGLRDMLTDMRHLCRAEPNNLNFDAAVEDSATLFEKELEGRTKLVR